VRASQRGTTHYSIMGAVFLLMLLPIVAALGFMLKTITMDAAGGGLLAALMFVFLSGVIGYMSLKMARSWDGEEPE
jgi:hypothetical protein